MKLSIITINRNNQEGLIRTVESIVQQTNSGFEYIIIDGDSEDGSREVIRKYVKDIDIAISEKDTGIYNAMNKGIQKASGEYCLFLNSGDWLYENTTVARLLLCIDGKADIYYSDLCVSNGLYEWLIRYPDHIDASFFISNTISHQNAAIRRQLLLDAGMYREDFMIASDWFFFLYSAYKMSAVFSQVTDLIAKYYHEGISTNPKFYYIKEVEHKRGINEIFGPLGPSLNELREYRSSVYGNTIQLFGYSNLLKFLLMTYRFFARRIKRVSRKKIKTCRNTKDMDL